LCTKIIGHVLIALIQNPKSIGQKHHPRLHANGDFTQKRLGANTISKALAKRYSKSRKLTGSKIRKEINMNAILIEVTLMVLRIVLPVVILLGIGEIIKRQAAKRGNL